MQRSMLGLAATLILTANLACADVVVVRDRATRVSGIYTSKTIPGNPLHAVARDLGPGPLPGLLRLQRLLPRFGQVHQVAPDALSRFCPYPLLPHSFDVQDGSQ
jgi:hypothetical protein